MRIGDRVNVIAPDGSALFVAFVVSLDGPIVDVCTLDGATLRLEAAAVVKA